MFRVCQGPRGGGFLDVLYNGEVGAGLGLGGRRMSLPEQSPSAVVLGRS